MPAMRLLDGTRIEVPAAARAVLEVDLAALRANWRLLADRVAPANCSAVVKADAYGLGAKAVSQALWNEGCTTFFVATRDEGLALRATLPEAIIYVLDGIWPGGAPEFAFHQLRPVLSSLAQLSEWADICRNLERSIPAALQVDTGMSRLGLGPNDIAWLMDEPAAYAPFQPSLILSHLASADDLSDPMALEQNRRFQACLAQLPATAAALANSAGARWWDELRFDLVRPGIWLYGGRTRDDDPDPPQTVVRLYARVIQVFDVPAGANVGYGRRFTAQRPARLATVSVGYADGYPRAAVNEATGVGPQVYLADGQTTARIVGRVSMDMLTIDITDLPADALAWGDWVVLANPPALAKIADAAGTIDYEILTHLGPRAHRIYRDGDRPVPPPGPDPILGPTAA